MDALFWNEEIVFGVAGESLFQALSSWIIFLDKEEELEVPITEKSPFGSSKQWLLWRRNDANTIEQKTERHPHHRAANGVDSWSI